MSNVFDDEFRHELNSVNLFTDHVAIDYSPKDANQCPGGFTQELPPRAEPKEPCGVCVGGAHSNSLE